MPDSFEVVCGDNSGHSCDIATAAYGSSLDTHLNVLINLRDKYLLTNSLGQAFVNSNYRYSPTMANIISKHDTVKAITRRILSTVVFCIEYPYIMTFALPVGIMLIYHRKKISKSIAA